MQPSSDPLAAEPRQGNIFEAIPLFARSLLVAGPPHAGLLELLGRRPGLSVTQAAQEELAALAGAQVFDVLLVLPGDDVPATLDALSLARPLLDSQGRLLVFLPLETSIGRREVFISRVVAADLQLYNELTAHGRNVLVFVSPGYDPLQHAVQLAEAGRPDCAYEVLEQLPLAYLKSTDVILNVLAERLLFLLQWAKASDTPDSLEFASIAQELFNRIVALDPGFQPAYQCRAEFWRLLGRDDMAARLLNTLMALAPGEQARRQLLGLRPAPVKEVAPGLPEDWEAPGSPLRILFLLHPRPHYGLDVLYDGLCTVLGADQVLDYPLKPWLHGEGLQEMANYPCTFDHPTHGLGEEELLDLLSMGHFDCVLYGDVEATLPQSLARRISALAKDCPFFLLDQVDEAVDTQARCSAYLGRNGFTACFKREMIAGISYGERVYPLPFAYPDRLVPAQTTAPRKRPFFWAGHRRSGLRRIYLERIEKLLAVSLAETIEQDQYRATMQDSVIGLNLFGFGFDTVRYWELPAHGCMLLSEKLPIAVPANFTDGESAVFFDDLPDLEAKLGYYLEHLEEAETIARRGHAHFLRHHTGSARARQMLAWMRQHLEK